MFISFNRIIERNDLLKIKSNLLLKTGIVISFIVFIIAVLRGAATGITYDEAYTYIVITSGNMLDPHFLKQLFNGSWAIANNHWLNSYLIYFIDRFANDYYNEFIIRIPSLFFYAVYLIFVCKYYKKGYYTFPVLVVFTGNYYLNEFYGLARGYGMANTFVFLLCMHLIAWEKSDYCEMKHLNWAMLCAMFGIFSNTVVLLLYPAVGFLCLYRLIENRRFQNFIRRSGIVFLIFLIFSVVMSYYHLCITADGKPLVTGYDAGFFDCFVKGYLGMFITKEKYLNILSIAFAVFIPLALIISRKKLKTADFTLMMIIFVITNLVMQAFFQKGYIANRSLLPFYTFTVLAIAEIIGAAVSCLNEKCKNILFDFVKMALSIILCLSCLFLFSKKINVHKTRDWSDNYRYRYAEVGELITGKPYTKGLGPHQVFYEEKYDMIRKDYLLMQLQETPASIRETDSANTDNINLPR